MAITRTRRLVPLLIASTIAAGAISLTTTSAFAAPTPTTVTTPCTPQTSVFCGGGSSGMYGTSSNMGTTEWMYERFGGMSNRTPQNYL
ncbi:hypothetical protein [Streptomyces sp. NPDC048349]|uniref:hypothetical protein n=1 Tax=Streptomyces sp. NPDC048349 TaxID=3155486 RepID=UPI0034492B57